MKQLITDFPQNIQEAIGIAGNVRLKKPEFPIQNVLICGMGGSGIGANLVINWLADQLPVPVAVVKDYKLPAYVGKNTLVIASSYSGNTEETLACLDQALAAQAQIIGVTSGGMLAQLAAKEGFDVVIVPGGNPPRTALAFSIVQLINIFIQLGMASPSNLEAMDRARIILLENQDKIHKEAEKLAAFLKGKVGVLYGVTDYEPVLIRARQQFNENSKELCWHHVIPEMNHNELVGWGGGDDRFAVVFFDNESVYARNIRRTQITKEKVLEKTANVMELKSKGNNIIERSIYLIHLVDWASYYLAELKNVDSIDIAVIDYLKTELGNYKG